MNKFKIINVLTLRVLITFIWILGVTSCIDLPIGPGPGPGDPPEPDPNDSLRITKVQLKYGESIKIDDAGTQIIFDELLEESRCPEGAVCLWAGNAKIKLRIGIPEMSSRQMDVFELNTNLDPKSYLYEPKIISEKNHRTQIELVDLLPHPSLSKRMLRLEDYVATLLITKY
ncbi:MAG: hypothetical protein HW421_2297 [Ignavibacteria bacterium]|nr:hypothetical protein [Ignavibacteria bacterium]